MDLYTNKYLIQCTYVLNNLDHLFFNVLCNIYVWSNKKKNVIHANITYNKNINSKTWTRIKTNSWTSFHNHSKYIL